MANVTEKDIIDHLKEKIRFHEKEVKRIHDLMLAFMAASGPAKGKQLKAAAISEANAPLPEKEKNKSAKGASKPKGNVPASPGKLFLKNTKTTLP